MKASPSRSVRERGRAAFTLIELLVVIGIILILAAILTPVVNRGVGRARAALCMSHLRQIGLRMQGHIHDHDGFFPSLHNRPDRSDPRPAIDTRWPDDHAIHGCPADRRDLVGTTGTSYFWNITLNGQNVDGVFSVLGGSVPSRIPLVADKESFHPGVGDGVNIVYVDGHVGRDLRFSDSLP